MLLRAVLFDLDGVLVDSLRVMRTAFTTSYHRLVASDREAPVEEYLRYSGQSFGAIMREMGLPAAMEPAFREESLRLASRISLHEGVTDVLRRLAAARVQAAVVTGKDRMRTLDLLHRLEIRHFFSAVVTACDVARCKPDPEPLYDALRQMGVDAGDSVMIGDSTSDMIAAVRASVRAWGAGWGIGAVPDLYAAGAEVVFQRPAELLLALERARPASTPRSVV